MKNFEMRAVAAIAFWALGLAPLCPSHSIAQEPPSTVPPGVSDQAAFEPPTVEESRPTGLETRQRSIDLPALEDAPGELRYRHRWAVVVGVNYDEADRTAWSGYGDVPELLKAEGDAEAVARVLTEKYGYDPDSVRVLIGKQATKQAIEDLLFEGLF